MKILFFIDSLRSGGKERRFVELLKGLSNDKSYDFEIVLIKNDIHYKDIHDLGIKVHIIPRKYFKKDPTIFFKFYKISKKYNPDIIHVWGNMVAIYAIPTKLFQNKKMINNQITSAPLKVTKSLLNNGLSFTFSDLLISNTFAGLESFSAPEKKSKVIYNGFDFSRIVNLVPEDIIKKKFKITTKYVVGMVASFDYKKDYKTYIQAAISILSDRRDITFLCIGAGNSKVYEALCETITSKKNILFLGKQTNVESIMNICDIGVLTTNHKVHGEGISNALLEFSALQKPVIATRGGGTPEIIIDEKSGYLVNPFSIEELVDRIKYLIENESIRKEFGIESKRIAESKFNIKNMINEFKEVYKELIK